LRPEPDAERTFAFVDLAGFTALTEMHGDHGAVDLIEQFEGLIELSLAPGDEFVKMIGDAAMLAFPDPLSALHGLQQLFETCDRTSPFPELRAGAHHGPALRRNGDWFGSTINLTARVTALARSGQILVTATVGAAARASYRVTDLGCFELRNIHERVELFDVTLRLHSSGLVTDPVCQMRLDLNSAVGFIRLEGEEFRFCSIACVQRFATDPDRFTRPKESDAPR
jgi:adenylate cyclase